MKTSIRDLMKSSGVGFGTSGARGLADAMTDRVCYAYTCGFLQYLESVGVGTNTVKTVAVAGDYRPSTGRIMEAVARAAVALGYRVQNCGRIPSPAIALFGLVEKIPTIMVTGSHIPDDRNGIKFNKPTGEILKEDEQGIAGQVVEIDESQFGSTGCFQSPAPIIPPSDEQAAENYVARNLNFFGPTALEGMRVGVYQHSAVGRDLLVNILSGLGAKAVPLGRSEKFIPVDTEAIRPEDVQLAKDWAAGDRFDAIVSTDGDSDRPLVSDERGCWLRGDVVGILCARFLEAEVVCTPVSCNSAVEKCGWFKEVHRTRIGSPYVIAAMNQAFQSAKRVMGYEANGGFLINSDIPRGGRVLSPLPTRDAVIVILSMLVLARQKGQRISDLTASLPQRFTASDRLKDFPTAKSARIISSFNTGSLVKDCEAIHRVFGSLGGSVAQIDRTDGVRVTFENQEIIHLRPSGNAPEFRCYTEAATEDRARSLNAQTLGILATLPG